MSQWWEAVMWGGGIVEELAFLPYVEKGSCRKIEAMKVAFVGKVEAGKSTARLLISRSLAACKILFYDE